MLKTLLACALVSQSLLAITYAPRQKPVQGSPKLACLALKWQDFDKISQGQCASDARQTAEFYRRNSRGLLNFQPEGFQVAVPFNGAPKNLANAEDFAMNKHPGFDYYQIIGHFLSVSHAGRKVAHLIGALYRDGQHEVGHLLGLGHAGAYKVESGKLVLDAYGDGQSVMSKMPSNGLTAPQYYHQGWLFEKEAAIWEEGQAYQIRRVNDFAKKDMLATVIVPNEKFKKQPPEEDLAEDDVDQEEPIGLAKKPAAPRDAYLSFPLGCDSCVALHLSNGGGSQRVKIFGKEYFDEDFTGMHIKVLSSDSASVTVSVDFQKKPQ